MINYTSQFNRAHISRNKILIFHVIYRAYCTLSLGLMICILILLTFQPWLIFDFFIINNFNEFKN